MQTVRCSVSGHQNGGIKVKKILAAIDGSEISEKVLHNTKHMGEKLEADVFVVTVVKRIKPSYHYRIGADYALAEMINKEAETRARTIIEHADEMFKDYPGNYQSTVLYGEPAEELLMFTESEKPDLLIMGNRGLGGFERIMLGSVSTKVLHHAACDMMIIKEG